MSIKRLKAGIFLLFRSALFFVDFLIPKKQAHVTFYCSPLKDYDTNSLTLMYELRNSQVVVTSINNKQTKRHRLPDNIKQAEYGSITGLWALLCSATIIFDHSAPPGIFAIRRQMLNIWHGIPIKKIRRLTDSIFSNYYLKIQELSTTATICSSAIDQKNMAIAFNLPRDQVWLTGLPRNDLLPTTSSLAVEPLITRQQLKIKDLKKDRKLFLYAPTYRHHNMTNVAPFNEEQLHQLSSTLKYINGILIIRMHSFVEAVCPSVDSDTIFFLDGDVIPDSPSLLRETDVLITDYSSIWVDFLLCKKPMIGYFYDLETYQKDENGLIYDITSVFPGIQCQTFATLLKAIKASLYENADTNSAYLQAIRQFHVNQSGQSTKAVIQRLGLL